MTLTRRRTLGQLAQRITDGSHNPPKGIETSSFLMLSSKNVFDDDVNYDDPRYLSEEAFRSEDRRTQVAPGDVLLTIVGTIGRCAVVSDEAPRFTLQRSVAVIRPKSELISPRFLMYSLILGSDRLNAQARGVAQKGIYLESLREFEVTCPPLDRQHEIVASLDATFSAIADAKAIVQRKLFVLDELRVSFLRNLLTDSAS